MHEAGADILPPDPLTGRPSFIHSPRIDVGARALGIASALEDHAPRQSPAVDGWFATAARVAKEHLEAYIIETYKSSSEHALSL